MRRFGMLCLLLMLGYRIFGYRIFRFSGIGFSDVVGALLVGARPGSGLFPLACKGLLKALTFFKGGAGGLIVLNTIKGLRDGHDLGPVSKYQVSRIKTENLATCDPGFRMKSFCPCFRLYQLTGYGRLNYLNLRLNQTCRNCFLNLRPHQTGWNCFWYLLMNLMVGKCFLYSQLNRICWNCSCYLPLIRTNWNRFLYLKPHQTGWNCSLC